MNEQLAAQLGPLIEALAETIARRVIELTRQAAGEEGRTPGRSPWLAIESAAAYLDLPKQRLYRLTASGQIPHYKQEGRLLFHRGELDEWLRSFAQPARVTGSPGRSELSVRRA